MTSRADQTLAELGGAHSVLARQERDHVELDRLINAVDESSGAQRKEYLNELCRLVFRTLALRNPCCGRRFAVEYRRVKS